MDRCLIPDTNFLGPGAAVGQRVKRLATGERYGGGMGYIIYECSAEGCSGSTGFYIRDIDAANWEKWHGYFDGVRDHNLRKVGESDHDPTLEMSTLWPENGR